MSVGEILDRDDRPAFVRFETRAITDPEATLREGRHISKDIDWALITPPYSKDCVEKKVDSWLHQVKINVKNGRVPEAHYQYWKKSYEAWKEGQEAPVNGTSVKEWSAISPAQCKNLINAGCRTIEDLAGCNDEGLRRVGMGAIDLRNKAVAWLQAAKDHGPLMTQVASLQNENEQLKGSVESLQEQIKLLTIQLDARQPMSVINEVEEPVGISASDIMEGVDTGVPTATEVRSKSPAERYAEKFGKPPHHRMKEENILKALE